MDASMTGWDWRAVVVAAVSVAAIVYAHRHNRRAHV
jgi:hypothetical protein